MFEVKDSFEHADKKQSNADFHGQCRKTDRSNKKTGY